MDAQSPRATVGLQYPFHESMPGRFADRDRASTFWRLVDGYQTASWPALPVRTAWPASVSGGVSAHPDLVHHHAGETSLVDSIAGLVHSGQRRGAAQAVGEIGDRHGIEGRVVVFQDHPVVAGDQESRPLRRVTNVDSGFVASGLPATSGDEDTPVYWQTVQAMASGSRRPDGIRRLFRP